MLPVGRIAAFGLTALVVIVIPGPSVLFVIGRALASGRRVAVLTVIGNALGEYMQVIAVAVGVGALAEQSVAAFTTLKLVGGVYLIYLGVKTFRERKSLAAALAAPVPSRSDGRAFLEGATVGVTNPKTVVFLAAILPQFVSRGQGHVAAQILLLGTVFAAIAIMSDTAWAIAGGALRKWFSPLAAPARADRRNRGSCHRRRRGRAAGVGSQGLTPVLATGRSRPLRRPPLLIPHSSPSAANLRFARIAAWELRCAQHRREESTCPSGSSQPSAKNRDAGSVSQWGSPP